MHRSIASANAARIENAPSLVRLARLRTHEHSQPRYCKIEARFDRLHVSQPWDLRRDHASKPRICTTITPFESASSVPYANTLTPFDPEPTSAA